MLTTIREIGKWQIRKSNKNEFEVLVNEPNFKEGGKIVFVKIDLDTKLFLVHQ